MALHHQRAASPERGGRPAVESPGSGPIYDALVVSESRGALSNDTWAAAAFLLATGWTLYQSADAQWLGDHLERPSLATALGIGALAIVLSAVSLALFATVPRAFTIVSSLVMAIVMGLLTWSTENWVPFVFTEACIFGLMWAAWQSPHSLALQQSLSRRSVQLAPALLLNCFTIGISITFFWFTWVMFAVIRPPWGFAWTIFVNWWFASVVNNFTKAVVSSIAAREYVGLGRGQFRQSLWCAICAFGSICLGSLITTVTSIMSIGLRTALQHDREDKLLVTIVKLVLRIYVWMFEDFVKRFNRHSLSYAALTGKGYFASASRARDLMASYPQLEQAVWADTSVPTALSTVFMGAAATAGAAVVGASAPVVGAVAMGTVFVHDTSMRAVFESQPMALFVCASEERMALRDAQQQQADAITAEDVHQHRQHPAPRELGLVISIEDGIVQAKAAKEAKKTDDNKAKQE